MNAPQDITALAQRIITVNLPAKQDLDAKANRLLASAQSLLIDSDSMNEIAADDLRSIKTRMAEIEETRKSHVGPLNEEVKYINDWFRGPRAALEQAESCVKGKMIAFQEDQERLRREEQRRIEEEQRKERARIAAENAAREKAAQEEAAAKRREQEEALAKERAAQEEAAKRQAEIDAAIKAGDEASAQEATRLQIEAEQRAAREKEIAAQAEKDAAATVTAAAEQSAANETAMMVMTAPVMPAPVKVAGISTKGTYKGECIDLLAMVKFIAANPQYINLVKANDTAINQLAKAQRDAMQIDGVRVWEEKTIAARKA